MTRYELDVQELILDLKKGQGWVLYFDNGPSGPCGQSFRTVCPHAELHVFNDEDSLREFLASKPFRNPKGMQMLGVVGEWTSPGVFSVVDRRG